MDGWYRRRSLLHSWRCPRSRNMILLTPNFYSVTGSYKLTGHRGRRGCTVDIAYRWPDRPITIYHNSCSRCILPSLILSSPKDFFQWSPIGHIQSPHVCGPMNWCFLPWKRLSDGLDPLINSAGLGSVHLQDCSSPFVWRSHHVHMYRSSFLSCVPLISTKFNVSIEIMEYSF